MRALLWLVAGLVGLGAAAAYADGPVLDPPPPNTACPSGKNLKLVWLANEVATDGGAAGPGYAETMIVCHSTEKSDKKEIDVFVELYDSSGSLVSTAAACDLQPGHTAAFVTLPTVPPYLPVGPVSAFSPQGAVTPPGSLRIMATKPKIVCDVTLYDTYLFHGGWHPGPAWSKDVTLTKAKARQKGD
jgi:hypothetical protein